MLSNPSTDIPVLYTISNVYCISLVMIVAECYHATLNRQIMHCTTSQLSCNTRTDADCSSLAVSRTAVAGMQLSYKTYTPILLPLPSYGVVCVL